ncbi:hypothetical protein [Thermosphaera aggregans]|jgi:hypothetical protein|uniref:Uncharacterized protein n=1 Tax=Thermosphaera aggregans (strain DSM 11486 / M11TL) TaxID=633148 RepID=D5U382_THEAM|nr:hypothetical protein [Thermosphaera aggregans]ADG91582.1 hypothetical protein Tagg_1321 [Thermosphaera aggregans DSM 11486]
MVKIKKVVLVTAKHHPYHKMWVKMAEDLSKRVNSELEVKEEDYVYLVEHGDKDEFGMAWAPQILVELDDGRVQWLLSQLPLNEALQPDESKAQEIMLEKIRSLGVEIAASPTEHEGT